MEMGKIKIATFNVEWMVNLFKQGKAEFWEAECKSRGLGRKPKDVPMVCSRLAGVIRDMKADIIGIEEGPPRRDQLERFVSDYLGSEYDVYSMPDGRQSVHALVRRGLPVAVEQLPASHRIYRHLSRKLEYYTWGEVRKSRLEKFTRKPVVLSLRHAGWTIEVMVAHTKSKFCSLKRKKQWTSRDKAVIVDALKARQKLSAEMAAMRRYITHGILSQRVAGCILMGDFNDGPNRDIFEEKFLLHNIVDELRGGFHREKALVHHALPQAELVGKNGYTAEFRDPTRNNKMVRVLLDHILVTGGFFSRGAPIRLRRNSGKIEHAAYNRHTRGCGRQAHERPSDHRPVSAVFTVS